MFTFSIGPVNVTLKLVHCLGVKVTVVDYLLGTVPSGDTATFWMFSPLCDGGGVQQRL